MLTGAIANGVILFYPMHGSSNPVLSASPTVLPPLTESAKAHYAAELKRYSKQLQNAHTQQDHRAIADTLAHLGCREAATRQYEDCHVSWSDCPQPCRHSCLQSPKVNESVS